MEPIYKIYAACVGEKEETVDEMLKSVGVYLTQQQLQSSARVLLRAAFKRFFGESAGFVDMVLSNMYVCVFLSFVMDFFFCRSG